MSRARRTIPMRWSERAVLVSQGADPGKHPNPGGRAALGPQRAVGMRVDGVVTGRFGRELPGEGERCSLGGPLEPGGPPLEVHADGDFVLASMGGLVISMWRTAGDLDQTRAVLAQARALMDKRPDGIGFLFVLAPGSKPPGGRAKKEVIQFWRENRSRIRGTTNAFLAEGLWSSVGRLFLATTAMVLFRRDGGIHIASSVEESAAWIGPRLGLSSDAVVDAVRGIRWSWMKRAA